MSLTYMTIYHCDGCGTTADGEDRTDSGELVGWFHLDFLASDMAYDYCSGRCLFAHSGVQNPAGERDET